MTRTELIELMNDMYKQMNTIAADLTLNPCAVQDDVNELYNLATFLPYDCDADDEDDDDEDEDEDEEDEDEWVGEDEDEWEDWYETGKAEGYEEGYKAGYIEGIKRGLKS